MNAVEQLRNFLDTDRLAVGGALVSGPKNTKELAQFTGLDTRRVLEAVGALKTALLVTSDDERHHLAVDVLRDIGHDLVDPDLPMDPVIGFGMTDDEREVLSRFFEGRTLTSVPTSRAKRLIVLERLALEFDVGKKYPEREVNSILGGFNPDWSTLRRHLIDEGLLDREQNVYWRSGGRVSGVFRG
ncbi:MAG: hypothetical protein ACJAR2_002355 [Ilumatobacter sp.]|jgi:hypothetical protein